MDYLSVDDHTDMIEDDNGNLIHHCNPRVLMVIGPGTNKYFCKRLNNRTISQDNNKRTLKYLPNELSLECIKRVIKTGVA